MTTPDMPRIEGAIHYPNAAQHFMKLKPVDQRVRVSRGGAVLAEATRALRLLEVGKDLCDPVLYIWREDVVAELPEIPDMLMHCPLKGDGAYPKTLGFAGVLAG